MQSENLNFNLLKFKHILIKIIKCKWKAFLNFSELTCKITKFRRWLCLQMYVCMRFAGVCTVYCVGVCAACTVVWTLQLVSRSMFTKHVCRSFTAVRLSFGLKRMQMSLCYRSTTIILLNQVPESTLRVNVLTSSSAVRPHFINAFQFLWNEVVGVGLFIIFIFSALYLSCFVFGSILISSVSIIIYISVQTYKYYRAMYVV